jgi:hypothetical protein
VDGGLDGLPHHAVGVEAEQVGDGLGDEGDPQAVVEDDDGVDAALHERAEGHPAVVEGAGQLSLPAHEDQLGAGGRDERGDSGQAAHDGVDPDGQETAQDGDDGDGDPADGEEPGAPRVGSGRERSRRLPQTEDGHAVSFGRRGPALQRGVPSVTRRGERDRAGDGGGRAGDRAFYRGSRHQPGWQGVLRGRVGGAVAPSLCG